MWELKHCRGTVIGKWNIIRKTTVDHCIILCFHANRRSTQQRSYSKLNEPPNKGTTAAFDYCCHHCDACKVKASPLYVWVMFDGWYCFLSSLRNVRQQRFGVFWKVFLYVCPMTDFVRVIVLQLCKMHETQVCSSEKTEGRVRKWVWGGSLVTFYYFIKHCEHRNIQHYYNVVDSLVQSKVQCVKK